MGCILHVHIKGEVVGGCGLIAFAHACHSLLAGV